MRDTTDEYIAVLSTVKRKIRKTEDCAGHFDLNSDPYVFDAIDTIDNLGALLKNGKAKIYQV